jgi:hypothetical protein
MHCSCRTFREEHLARPWCFPSGALISKSCPPNPPMRVPETPPFNSGLGGVLVLTNDAPSRHAAGRLVRHRRAAAS